MTEETVTVAEDEEEVGAPSDTVEDEEDDEDEEDEE